jgi:hypothetical protein
MKDHEAQKREICEWFRERFVETEVCDPRESSVSGYQYSCGGPYFAGEIIRSQFRDSHSADILEEAIKELEAFSLEWARRKTEDYPVLP